MSEPDPAHSPADDAGDLPGIGDGYLRSLEDLLGLLLEDTPFEALLEQVLELTARAVPGTDAAAVTVTRADGRVETAAASDEPVREFDEAQRAIGAGPCVEAMRTGEERWSDDLTTDERYPPAVREAARRSGLRSVLAVPLSAGQVVGALNVFSRSPGGIDEEARRTARGIAAPVAATLANARAYRRVEQLTGQLREALQTRATIEQAKGILMARLGIDDEAAFDLLRRTSQHHNRKLRDVAAAIVARRDQLPGSR